MVTLQLLTSIPGEVGLAYEISKLPDDEQQREALTRSPMEGLTHDQLAETDRKRKPKQPAASRGVKQIFTTESGWKVTVTAPHQGS